MHNDIVHTATADSSAADDSLHPIFDDFVTPFGGDNRYFAALSWVLLQNFNHYTMAMANP